MKKQYDLTEMYGDKPRYLILSDGQKLDRKNLPRPDLASLTAYRIKELKSLAESGFVPLKSRIEHK